MTDEREMLRLRAQGYTNPEIAQQLGMTRRKVLYWIGPGPRKRRRQVSQSQMNRLAAGAWG